MPLPEARKMLIEDLPVNEAFAIYYSRELAGWDNRPLSTDDETCKRVLLWADFAPKVVADLSCMTEETAKKYRMSGYKRLSSRY